MGDEPEAEPESGPPPEFHPATVFDGEVTPVALRQLPGLWRAGLALALVVSAR